MAEVKKFSISAKIKEAGRHSIIYGMGSVMQSASGLILLPILTGLLTKDDFGAYSLILMACGIASAIFYFGMTSALPRSYFDYESIDDRRAVFTTAFIFLLSGALLQSVFGYIFSSEISRILIGSSRYEDAVCYGLIGSALGFINTYFFAYLRMLRKSIASVLFSVISLVGTIGLTYQLLSLKHNDVTAPFEAIAYTQVIVAILFIAIYGKSAFILKITTKEIPNLLRFGVISIAASFGGLLIESIDRLMITHFLGLGDVGVYSAAMRIGMLINVMLIIPFTQMWSPMMIEHRTKNNINELFTKMFSVFMILGGLVVILGSLFATELLPIFIRSGTNSAIVYIFLTCLISLLIYSSVNFFSAGLIFERKVHLLPFAYYGVVLLKFLANLFLIPLFGLVGAAFSTFMFSLLLPFAVNTVAKKYFTFKIEWARLSVFVAFISPSLIYGYYSSFYPSINIVFRIFWLLITLLLLYRYCLTCTERLYIKNLRDKLILKIGWNFNFHK
jgi:O-antigen/teichoic acid export membrane protein